MNLSEDPRAKDVFERGLLYYGALTPAYAITSSCRLRCSGAEPRQSPSSPLTKPAVVLRQRQREGVVGLNRLAR